VKLSDARQRFVTIRNLRALNAARINTILARPLQAPVIPAEPAGALPEPLALETAWQAAEERRPEIRIIDSELRITGHRETVRRAEFFPTLFAEGGYNYTQNRYQVHPDNWSVTGGLKINLFSGGSTRAELAKLSLRATQLQEQRRKLVEDLRFEVQQYYLEETNARENVITARDAVGQAEENLRINRLRYEAGLGTATDVLDAIALRTLAEKNYCKALYDLRRARAALLYAMGEDLTRRSQ
jgi:outer membrane protein TolC